MLGLAPGGGASLLLDSVEGGAPANTPALSGINREQLETHDPEDGLPPAAMLFGMSGDVRWSLSIEAREEAGTLQLLFDAAARMPSRSIASVASRYRVSPSAVLDPSGVLRLGGAGGRFTLRPIELGGAACGLRLVGADLGLELPLGDYSPPTTVRWGYVLSADA